VEQRKQNGEELIPMPEFLSEVSLLTDQDENQNDDTPRVTLLTVHAAKGLEFRVAFIVGLEENLFPSQFCQAAHEIEEERRLLYVAITRAMEHCYLTYARQRFRNGQTVFSSPSRFIKDIDSCYLQQFSASAPISSPSSRSTTAASTAHTAKASAPTLPQGKLVKITSSTEANKRTHREVRSEWRKNDRVMHHVFGAGTVLDVYREMDNDKIDILFDEKGRKTLLLTYAKLTKI
jgi:DNA helicase-2/ATP-dependent DNA helicase PcrA